MVLCQIDWPTGLKLKNGITFRIDIKHNSTCSQYQQVELSEKLNTFSCQKYLTSAWITVCTSPFLPFLSFNITQSTLWQKEELWAIYRGENIRTSSMRKTGRGREKDVERTSCHNAPFFQTEYWTQIGFVLHPRSRHAYVASYYVTFRLVRVIVDTSYLFIVQRK